MQIKNINEIFISWQGEGMYMGREALFIRFAGCNMNSVGGRFCSFCDTKHAQVNQNSKTYDFGKIFQKFREAYKGKLIVFTGGEPLLYSDEIMNLIMLLGDEYHIQIETNGSLPFNFEKNYPINKMNPVVFSISPKLPPAIKKSYPLRIFESIYSAPTRSYLKFVVDKDNPTIEEHIISILDQYSLSPYDVWLMPQGITKGEIDSNIKTCIELATKYQFNLSMRMQIEYGLR